MITVQTRVEVLDLNLEPLERVPAGEPFITLRRRGLRAEAVRWESGRAVLLARRLSRYGALRAIGAVVDVAWWIPFDYYGMREGVARNTPAYGVVKGLDGPGGQLV